jgi:hypothetical protein
MSMSEELSVQTWRGTSSDMSEGRRDDISDATLSHDELISMAFASQLPGAKRPKSVLVQRPKKLTSD